MRNILSDLNIQESFRNPLILIVSIVVIWLIGQFFKVRINKLNLENKSRYKGRKTVTFIVYFLIVLVTIIIYSSNLEQFTLVLGVAGAGIAFALQEVIVSMAGWLALLFGNFYRSGDRIQIGDIKGDVIDVGILRTTLMETGEWVDGDLYNGRIVHITNSAVFKGPVFNYSGDFPFLWDEIKIPVRYGSDHEMARTIFKKVVDDVTNEFSSEAEASWAIATKKYRVEPAKTSATVTIVANDNWIEFTIRYVVDHKRRRVTKDKLYTNILNEVTQTSGAVQFGSATFELTGLPPVSLNSK